MEIQTAPGFHANIKMFPYDDSTNAIRIDLTNLKMGGSINDEFDLISDNFLANNYRDEEIIVGVIDKNSNYNVGLYLIEAMPGGANSSVVKNIVFSNPKTATSKFDPIGFKIRLLPIQIDADSTKELLLAYWDQDFLLHFVLFDQMNDSTLTEISSFVSQNFAQSVSSFQRLFAISTDDFDKDGKDEILLVGPAYVGGSQGEVLVEDIFDVDSSQMIVEKSTQNIIFDYESGLSRLDVASGKANVFYWRKAVVAFQVQENNRTTTRLKPFMVRQDLTGLLFSEQVDLVIHSDFTDYYSLDIEIADIMGSSAEKEVVVAFNGVLRVYILNELDQLILQDEISPYGDYEFASDNHKMSVKNLNRKIDPSDPNFEKMEKAEIAIVAREQNFDANNNNAFKISVFQWNDVTNQLELITEKIDSVNTFSDLSTPVGIIAGGFIPHDSYLGEPTHFNRTDILEPMVILNAPPVHLDQLNGTLYDVNSCYNGNNCGFSAVYKKHPLKQPN